MRRRTALLAGALLVGVPGALWISPADAAQETTANITMYSAADNSPRGTRQIAIGGSAGGDCTEAHPTSLATNAGVLEVGKTVVYLPFLRCYGRVVDVMGATGTAGADIRLDVFVGETVGGCDLGGVHPVLVDPPPGLPVHPRPGELDSDCRTFGDDPPAAEPEPAPAPEPERAPPPRARGSVGEAWSSTGDRTPAPADPGPAAPSSPGGAPFLPYTPDSPYRAPLPDDTPAAPDSATLTGYAETHDVNPAPQIRGVGGNAWGQPFALAGCDDPLWRVQGATTPGSQHLASEGFHAPAGFGNGATGTSDSPMTVFDTCGVPSMPGGQAVWLFRASPAGEGVVRAENAAAMDTTSNGLDGRHPASDNPANRGPRGNIIGANVIRDDLIRYAESGGNDGTLGHALELFWWETDSAAGHTGPMVGDEKGKGGEGAEGRWFRLPADWTPPPGCDGAAAVVARTLQRHGGYIGDNAGGGGGGFKAQQGSTSLTPDALEPCLSWGDLQFLPSGFMPGQ